MNDDTGAVKSATRVLDVLETLAVSPQPIGASELARRLSIPKSSTHMLLSTLEHRGYVLGDDTRRFRIHPALTGGGRAWVGGTSAILHQAAREPLRRLAALTRESAFLGVARDGVSFDYVQKRVSDHEVRCDAELAEPRALHSSSTGLVLLAFRSAAEIDRYLAAPLKRLTAKTVTDPGRLRRELAAVRKRGYAVTRDTNAAGASGMAAPIFDRQGHVVAGLNVSAPTSRFDINVVPCTARLVDEARAITAALTGTESIAA